MREFSVSVPVPALFYLTCLVGVSHPNLILSSDLWLLPAYSLQEIMRRLRAHCQRQAHHPFEGYF